MMLDEISQEKQALKNSAVIMFFKVLGLASALLLDILIAARIGPGTHTDAFFVAFTIPQLTAAILFVVATESTTTRGVPIEILTTERLLRYAASRPQEEAEKPETRYTVIPPLRGPIR